MNGYIGGGCWGYNGIFVVKSVLWGVGRREGVEGVLVGVMVCFRVKRVSDV